MNLETLRLIITDFTPSMAEAVHKNSIDEDTRKFLPDEVFETIEDAADTIGFLMNCYKSGDGPQVHPVLLKSGENIGYVQLVPVEEGYEVGYHIAKQYTRNGYATEALKAFVQYMMAEKELDKVYGICIAENIASRIVLEKCGFEKFFEGMGEYQEETREIVKYVYTLK